MGGTLSRGMKVRETDPVGRETISVYGTDGLPDADVCKAIDELIGCLKSGRGDVAENHDSYLYGDRRD